MKSLNVITHAVTLIISFSLVLISGEHLGGPYLLYLLLGLPHLTLPSVFGFFGVALLIFSNYNYKRSFKYLIEPILNITGILLMVLSLILFFSLDKNHYNDSTFVQTVPIISLSIFGLLSVVFIISNVSKFDLRSSRPLLN